MPIRSAPSSARIGAWSSRLRAGRIAERIAAAAIALRQHLLHVAGVLGGEAEFGADALVDVFGHRLGHLDRQPVQIEIVLVAVVREPVARDLGRLLPDRHDLQPDHVALGVVDVAEEVGDALAVLLRLARQGEARELASLPSVVEQDQVVALAGAPANSRRPPAAAGCPRASHSVSMRAQHRPQLLLRPAEEIVERAALLPEAPLELVELRSLMNGTIALPAPPRSPARPRTAAPAPARRASAGAGAAWIAPTSTGRNAARIRPGRACATGCAALPTRLACTAAR